MSLVTASQVRAYYRDPKAGASRTARLSPAAAHTVAPGARGRIHPEALAQARGKVKAYATGNSKAASEAAKSAAFDLRVKAKASGYAVGKRGPLPKAFLDSLKG